MKVDFTPDLSSLQKLTGFKSFTEERFCQKCTSYRCKGKELIRYGEENEKQLIDEYPCFIKARLLIDCWAEQGRKLLLRNRLLRYIGIKTQAVVRTTTRRGAYGNLGTLLILIKDYLDRFDNYEDYAGMQFNDYLREVRTLPGCSKVQNHPINHRLNEEFQKIFERTKDLVVIRKPIPGKVAITTYKINDELISENVRDNGRTVAKLMLDILSLYFYLRERGNLEVIESLTKMTKNPLSNEEHIINFLRQAMTHNDARMFEISSFVILQAWYATKRVFLGSDPSDLRKMPLRLYKTGRVTANDGGINYVLVPLGKFFQATQGFELAKFFLDIDKLSRFPITFVIQTEKSSKEVLEQIEKNAKEEYKDSEVVRRYLNSIEGVFTLLDLKKVLDELKNLPEAQKDKVYKELLIEFITQYSVEYNIS